MSNGKTNQNGRIEYAGLLRHREIELCTMSAMANYLVWRWEKSGEDFPSFRTNKDWYDIQLLITSPQATTKEISYSTQQQWIHKIYSHLGIHITKVTHAGRGSGPKEAEKLGIDHDQIQRQGRWAGDAMHKGYLTSLPRAFMRGMAGFQSEHAGTYFIARAEVEPPKELLDLVFPELNYWLRQPTEDIATKSFLKLLEYLRLVFLQDSVLLRTRYPGHSLWNLPVFSHPSYQPFAEDVTKSLDVGHRDLDSQIRTAMPILGQQVLNLQSSLTAMMSTGFEKQQQQFEKQQQQFEKQQQHTQQLESKLDDFLGGRIAFQMTPVKLSHLVKTAVSIERGGSSTNSIGDSISITPIPFDPRLDTSTSTQNAAVTTSFATPSERPESSSLANRYSLSRNTHKVTDLHREWYVGYGGQPSIASLNDEHGCEWRKDWPGKDREFYSKRLAIMKHVKDKTHQGGSTDAAAAALEKYRVKHKLSLNALAMKIRKGESIEFS
ncbi:uncharacterized protein CPUR_08876 [Claviceps purpurea 20.1]|uniref:Ndc10 domain-containing protein n=1 Tax=Claviceps purpurea (strain 20.1) TaxID=1111077 RepID=M1VZH7_CLAP2|nr:uncharacterized protein CPUR_08876 [Claviceps purpurea 20.1]